MTTGQKADKFSKHAAAVARHLYGEPNKNLSSKDELRFGKNGSVAVDLKAGRFFNHESKEGGGVLWAIEAETGKRVEGGEAVQWLRDNGFYIEDDGQYTPTPQAGPGGDAPRSGPNYDDNGNYLPQRVPPHGKLTATYDYLGADGALAYQVCRYDWDVPIEENPKGHAKTFTQRAPDNKKRDGWTYSVKGMTQLPYRLPELIEDIASGYEVFIVEGEKKADLLRDAGVPATCNSGGAGKWHEDLVDWFKGAKVTIILDADEAGRKHGDLVNSRLNGVAARVRSLELPGVPEHGSVDDWLPNGGSVEQLYELAEKAPPLEAAAYESPLHAVQWLDMDAPGPQHEHLIKKVLTRGEVSMLAGASQSGKTFLALDISMSVVRGVEWFGHRVLRGGVVYCASESAVGVRRKRLKAYRTHHKVEHENLPFVLLQKKLDLYTSDEDTELLIEEIKHWNRRFEELHGCRAELAVVDTVAAVTPGWDENSSRDVGPVLDRCSRVRDATGVHIMLVHHLNADGSKARGHTSLTANVENVIIVRKLENHHDDNQRIVREAVVTKQKEDEDGESIRFVLPAVGIGTDEDGDKITSCIVESPAGSKAAKNAAPTGITVSGEMGVCLRCLYDALENTFDAAPPALGLPMGARVADKGAVAKKYYEVKRSADFDTLDDDARNKEMATQRQQLRRAMEKLFERKIIGMDANTVWLTGKSIKGFGAPPGVARRDEVKPVEEPDALPFDNQDDIDALGDL